MGRVVVALIPKIMVADSAVINQFISYAKKRIDAAMQSNEVLRFTGLFQLVGHIGTVDPGMLLSIAEQLVRVVEVGSAS